MQLRDYKQLVANTFQGVTDILECKSNDYANNEETLLNFKQLHELCKVLEIRPMESLQDCGWFYVLMKLQRVLNLRFKDAANETVEDSIIDLINYIMLSRACAMNGIAVVNKRVYIAGPYGRRVGLSEYEIEGNVQDAIKAGIEIINVGYEPFIPHLYHYVHQGMFSPIEEDRWLQLCLNWISHCGALVRLEGFSQGGDREVHEAITLGIPVFFGLETFLKYCESNPVC